MYNKKKAFPRTLQYLLSLWGNDVVAIARGASGTYRRLPLMSRGSLTHGLS